MSEYYELISSIQPETEAFTGRHWNIPDRYEYHKSLQQRSILPGMMMPQCIYEYTSHLRHHGFPSPLLDWTISPYIAAYFAFKDITDSQDDVAIYAYVEGAGYGKSGWGNEPKITALGPLVRTHQRHFLQRSRYTICTQDDGTDIRYALHEQVFERADKDQDLLWKFVLPASERQKVLRFLDRINIRSFSLFGSEESLMESLALQEFVIRKE